MADVRWLGFDWDENVFHASDYFEQLYDWAGRPRPPGARLRRRPDGRRDPRDPRHADIPGTRLAVPGPERRGEPRPVRAHARGRVPERRSGAARQDRHGRPNINLRDPVLYRIVHASHPRTGDAWSIYPTYDMAHGQSDAIEGVTHSICTLEFEAHRPLYDWLIDSLPVPAKPHQIEFARLNLTYTVLSKRFLLKGSSTTGYVRGWDDPRMPTISGLRRRGFPAEGIRNFATADRRVEGRCDARVGCSSTEVRACLNRTSPRRFGVLDPMKVVINNWPEGTSSSRWR